MSQLYSFCSDVSHTPHNMTSYVRGPELHGNGLLYRAACLSSYPLFSYLSLIYRPNTLVLIHKKARAKMACQFRRKWRSRWNLQIFRRFQYLNFTMQDYTTRQTVSSILRFSLLILVDSSVQFNVLAFHHSLCPFYWYIWYILINAKNLLF